MSVICVLSLYPYLLKVKIMNPVFLFLALFGPFFVDPSGALVLFQTLVDELELAL